MYIENAIRQEIKRRKPFLENVKRYMQIRKYNDLKGAALDRKEWLRLQSISFTV